MEDAVPDSNSPRHLRRCIRMGDCPLRHTAFFFANPEPFSIPPVPEQTKAHRNPHNTLIIKSVSAMHTFNPNRSLDTPSPFLIGKVRLSGILPASVRILILTSGQSPQSLMTDLGLNNRKYPAMRRYELLRKGYHKLQVAVIPERAITPAVIPGSGRHGLPGNSARTRRGKTPRRTPSPPPTRTKD